MIQSDVAEFAKIQTGKSRLSIRLNFGKFSYDGVWQIRLRLGVVPRLTDLE